MPAPKDPKVQARNALIVEDFKKGMSRQELAVKYGVKRHRVDHIIGKSGVSDAKDKKDTVARRNRLIIEDYVAGLTLPQLSEKYEVSVFTIVKALQKAREQGSLVVRHRAGRPSKNTEAQSRNSLIVEDFQKGMSRRALADKYGVTRHSVDKVIEKSGVPDVKGKKVRVLSRVKSIAKDYRVGLTIQKISEKYGVSGATVVKAIRRTLGKSEQYF